MGEVRGTEADEWDEWGDAPAASESAAVHAPSTDKRLVSARESKRASAPPGDGSSDETDPLEWSWQIDALDEDLRALPPLLDGPTADAIAEINSADDRLLYGIAVAANATVHRVKASGIRVERAHALALVTQWHILQLRPNLEAQPPTHQQQQVDALQAIDNALRAIAGDWGVDADGATDTEDLQRLHEMTSLLHQSLSACDDDVTPFQQAFEQLFASLPAQQLVIPNTWIRPRPPVEGKFERVEPASSRFEAYLRRVMAQCDADASPQFRVPVLTETEAFQDAKDIQRDELVVNTHAISGTIGYDAIVTKLRIEILALLGDGTTSAIVDDAVDRVARQILNACNRTESGGCSYEILSQFVSNHDMERVLIRPDSDKAPPLQINMDVGAFFSEPAGGWCFGLRVHVSAVTWYWICDASDPTTQYYQIQTTYSNRLAFPLGQTPLSTATFMRRDHGAVTIQLVDAESVVQSDEGDREEEDDDSQSLSLSRTAGVNAAAKDLSEADVDLDDLL